MWNHPRRYKCQFVRAAVEAFVGDTGVLLLSFAVVVDESVPNGDGVESAMTSKMAVSLVDRFQQQRSLFRKLLAATDFFLNRVNELRCIFWNIRMRMVTLFS